MNIDIRDNEFLLEAAVIGELLGVPEDSVPGLMQKGVLKGVCERGVDEDAGTFRLRFACLGRRAQLTVDADGRVLERSIARRRNRPGNAAMTPI